MKAALYARAASTLVDSYEKSITGQFAYLEEYCSKHNIQVQYRYYDIGKGKEYNSTGLTKLLKDLEEGSVSIPQLIFTSSDRYSKTLMEAMALLQRFQKYGVEIIYVSEMDKSKIKIQKRKKQK
jgi:DNA invertase Pin-like site-specific DNA recombinase